MDALRDALAGTPPAPRPQRRSRAPVLLALAAAMLAAGGVAAAVLATRDESPPAATPQPETVTEER